MFLESFFSREERVVIYAQELQEQYKSALVRLYKANSSLSGFFFTISFFRSETIPKGQC